MDRITHVSIQASILVLGLVTQAEAQVRVLQVPIHPVHGQMIPRAISGDGRVVVGYANRKAMVWVIDQGIEVCTSPLLGSNSTASGISYDGSVVGGTTSAQSQTGYRWNRTSGNVTLLRDVSGLRMNTVVSVSGNGQTMLGDVFTDRRRAAFWNSGGITRLPQTIEGNAAVAAVESSYDGSRIVGALDNGKSFVWNAEQGTFLVPTPVEIIGAANLSMTANGDAIFGTAVDGVPGAEVFTWNPDTGASLIPSLAGHDVLFNSVNDDGRLLVGKAFTIAQPRTNYAVIRTLGLESILLGDYLALYGSTHANSDFTIATDVSDDGSVILGEGGIYPYWVVIVPPLARSDFNVNNFVDFTDLTDFLDCWEGHSSLPISSADLNRDGFTDFFDLIEFLDHF